MGDIGKIIFFRLKTKQGDSFTSFMEPVVPVVGFFHWRFIYYYYELS